MKINILGTEYHMVEQKVTEDSYLENCDGYVDKTSKRIVIKAYDSTCELDRFEVYQNKVKRHEIIHAFLYESGLGENWQHQMGHDETYVDWIAMQAPKLNKAFEEAGCL